MKIPCEECKLFSDERDHTTSEVKTFKMGFNDVIKKINGNLMRGRDTVKSRQRYRPLWRSKGLDTPSIVVNYRMIIVVENIILVPGRQQVVDHSVVYIGGTYIGVTAEQKTFTEHRYIQGSTQTKVLYEDSISLLNVLRVSVEQAKLLHGK